jgi:hypothetical protein
MLSENIDQVEDNEEKEDIVDVIAFENHIS